MNMDLKNQIAKLVELHKNEIDGIYVLIVEKPIGENRPTTNILTGNPNIITDALINSVLYEKKEMSDTIKGMVLDAAINIFVADNQKFSEVISFVMSQDQTKRN